LTRLLRVRMQIMKEHGEIALYNQRPVLAHKQAHHLLKTSLARPLGYCRRNANHHVLIV
ncbi:XylR N-terminal domain-containing protein, partial [Paenibacillus sepulcri]|nr:XylR N-terminal domain-containing protein [Paenibacillus sepulcri]